MLSENAYSRPVTLKNVLRFAVPTIVMTVFMSFYTMVDGLFVSNLIGTDALSAVNLTAPDYFTGNCHLYHACYGWKRCHYEKGRRAKSKGSK